MIIGILRESVDEHRVTMTPDIIAKKMPDCTFLIESEAGSLAGYSDEMFEKVGAKIEKNRKHILERAHIILGLDLIDEESIRYMRSGSFLIGQLHPLKNSEKLKQLARIGVSSFSLEWLPRTTRAQSMDILSSQNNLIGYQAVISAAFMLGRSFPLMMTAAGSVPAAKVLIVGAGIAGLQAIATAKRLGAVVSAFDVRASSKESVESLGATFIDVPYEESGEGQGGYAKEMSDSYKTAQEKKLLEIISQQDVIITTAQVPHKPAPKIITQHMVSQMKDGSLLIDLAGESGGNCELSQIGKEIFFENKRIFAPYCFINQLAHTASNLLASNLAAFIKMLLHFENGVISFDAKDDLIQKTLLTHNGVLIHSLLK